VDDVTTEKLTQVLSDNDGRAAIISTEGGIFDTLAGIYTKNVNIDVMLKGYSGDPIKVDRIGRCSESVMDPALTILLMAQPSVLSGLMKNDTFRGRGLTARFLYCIPTSYVGSRKYRSAPVPKEVRLAYETQIRNMLEDEYPKEPEIITLSPEADEMIEAFAEELEPKLKDEYAAVPFPGLSSAETAVQYMAQRSGIPTIRIGKSSGSAIPSLKTKKNAVPRM
jgi:hypothetical protein